MSMQATRVRKSGMDTEPAGAASGTFETERHREPGTSAIDQAHALAIEIDRLLTPSPEDSEPYSRRLARALAQSLVDQLADLSRDSSRPKVA
jgi:hypothetical protein